MSLPLQRAAGPLARLCSLAVLVVGAFSAWAQEGGGPPPQTVRVDPVRVEVVEQWRPVTGELRPLRRALLAAEEPGFVMELAVREGDAVDAGGLIARLRDAQAQIEVSRTRALANAARGLISQREAELAEFRLDLKRMQELFDRGSAAQTELDRASTAVLAAEALLTQAQASHEAELAELARAQRRVEDMTILAPFDGVVVSRRTEVGQWIAQGDAVVELVSRTDIEAWIDVPERYVDRLAGGTTHVRIVIAALEMTVEVPVTGIVPEVDPLSRLFPVRVALSNEDGRLRPGMSVTGVVPTGIATESVLVHKDAILRDDAGTFVYFAVGAPGAEVSAVARVDVLFAADANYLAVRGAQLSAGMRVVVEGNERMGFPGRPLIMINGQEAAGRGVTD